MDDDKELRRRLAELVSSRFRPSTKHVPRPTSSANPKDANAPAPSSSASPQLEKVLSKLPQRLRESVTTASALARQDDDVALDALVGEFAEEKETPVGPFCLLERSVGELSPRLSAFEAEYAALESGEAKCVALDSLHEDLQSLLAFPAPKRLFLDLETLGLQGQPVFLVGLLQSSGKRLLIRQLLARDYSEEAAMLHYLANSFAERQAVVTYNGKTFDLPLLRARAAVHHISLDDPPAHLDLLHESRRRWRHCMPDCRLQTVESFICRRSRRGDIPGSEIPAAYHEFVRTGNAARIGTILHHNALDLLTMAQIIHAILRGNDIPRPS